MTQRRKYTPRRKQNKQTYNRIKIYILLAAAIIAIASVAYRTCTKNANDQKLQQLAGNPDLAQLTQVITTNTDDARMLHYPGFDVLFSTRHHQPYYSAWILTPQNARATDITRTNNFRPDPDVAESAQLADYRNSGYDRGHIAPAADMRYSKDAMDACFLMTNMSPQKNTLNAKAWANLEDQCRTWAQRDSTIIIIAGPILNDHLTQTIGQTKVTVPQRYFKVVYAPYATPPRAIGFVMPNGHVQGGVQATAMTVDQVEQITGYDFFSTLPDELENQIEATAAYSQWQYTNRKHK